MLPARYKIPQTSRVAAKRRASLERFASTSREKAGAWRLCCGDAPLARAASGSRRGVVQRAVRVAIGRRDFKGYIPPHLSGRILALGSEQPLGTEPPGTTNRLRQTDLGRAQLPMEYGGFAYPATGEA